MRILWKYLKPQKKLFFFLYLWRLLLSLKEQDITDTISDISESRKQITILIAHRLSTIMHADVIYVLEKGKIVETGNHDELLQQKGWYYAMRRQQVGKRRIVPVG